MKPVLPGIDGCEEVVLFAAPGDDHVDDLVVARVYDADENPICLSRWQLTPEERVLLLDGQDLWVWVWGVAQPPISATIGLPPGLA